MSNRSSRIPVFIALSVVLLASSAHAAPPRTVLRAHPTHRQRALRTLGLNRTHKPIVHKAGVIKETGANVLFISAAMKVRQLTVVLTGRRPGDITVLNTPAKLKAHGLKTPTQALWIAKKTAGRRFGVLDGKTQFRGASEDGRAYKFETVLKTPLALLEGPDGHGKRVHSVVQYVTPFGAETAQVGKYDRLPAGSIPVPSR